MIAFRYFAKEIYTNMLAITLVVLALLMSNQFAQYLGEAAGGRLSLKAVLEIMSLQMPMLLGLMLPLGLYLGILLGYGRFYADYEMTVFAACGMSKAKLVRTTLLLSTAVMLVVAVLIFWVQPAMNWYKYRIKEEAIVLTPLAMLFPDQFQQIGNKWIVYADQLSRDHKRLRGVFIAQRAAKGGWNIVQAASGRQIVDKRTGDQYFVLKDGHRYTGMPSESEFTILNFNNYQLRLAQFAKKASQKIQALPTRELWKMRHNSINAMAELQWRISLPLSVLILGLIAVSLSEVKPRKGRYAKLVPAILIYIVYVDLLFMARAWLDKGDIPPSLGLWWVHALMFSIALALLCRFVGWGNIKRVFWGYQ